MTAPVGKITLHVVLPLIIGLIIYIIARPETWLVQKLFPFGPPLLKNGLAISSAGWFIKAIVFNGPDFCWAYSLTSALLFWNYFSGTRPRYFAALVFLLILVQEIVQLLITAHFTFDMMDIVAAVLAFLLSFTINRKYA
jgi:hypothetical protein